MSRVCGPGLKKAFILQLAEGEGFLLDRYSLEREAVTLNDRCAASLLVCRFNSSAVQLLNGTTA